MVLFIFLRNIKISKATFVAMYDSVTKPINKDKDEMVEDGIL